MRVKKSNILLLFMLFLQVHVAFASGNSKYSTLIRDVRALPSGQILAKGDTLLQRKEEDKALVMYMLVCSRTTDRMTDSELTECSLANLKAGDVFYSRGNYINALECYQTSQKLSESSDSKKYLALIYKNIGKAYCVFKDYDKGFEYYKKGYQCRPKNDRELTFKLLVNLFGACIDRNDVGGAVKYRQLMYATPHADNGVNRFLLTFSTALVASRQKQYAKANAVLKTLVNYSLQAKLPAEYVCSAYEEMYTNYKALGDMNNAMFYTRMCLSTAERNHIMHFFPETLHSLGQIYKQEGQVSLSQQYEAQYLNLMDSIYNARRFNVVKNQQFMYEVDKANKEISRLQQKEEAHRQSVRLYQLLLLVSVFAVVLVSALLFFVLRQKRSLAASYRKLYDLNRSQIEPIDKKATKKPTVANSLKEDQKKLLIDGILKVMEETDRYCQHDFTITSLAKLIGSNDRYVSWVINEHFNKTFTELLNDYRVKKACERLTTDAKYAHLTIAAIGQSVGYKSQTTFINQFRKCTGLTPSVYQKFAAEDKQKNIDCN